MTPIVLVGWIAVIGLSALVLFLLARRLGGRGVRAASAAGTRPDDGTPFFFSHSTSSNDCGPGDGGGSCDAGGGGDGGGGGD